MRTRPSLHDGRLIRLPLVLDADLGPVEADFSTAAIAWSNPSDVIVRATCDGSGAKDLANATKTANALVWQLPFEATDGVGLNGFDDDFQFEVHFSQPTASGIILVVGLCDGTSLTNWLGMGVVYGGSPGVETRDYRCVGQASVGTSGSTFKGGMGVRTAAMQSGLTRLEPYIFDKSTGDYYTGNAQWNSGSGGSVDWTGTSSLYGFAAVGQAAASGTLDIEGAFYRARQIRHGIAA